MKLNDYFKILKDNDPQVQPLHPKYAIPLIIIGLIFLILLSYLKDLV